MRYSLLLLIILITTAWAEDFVDISKVQNTIESLESREFLTPEQRDKKLREQDSKKVKLTKEQLAQKELDEIEKEQKRRLRDLEVDKESDDFLLQDPNLNDRYQRGRYLVYDCQEEHWVCTSENEYKRCELDRDEALKTNENNLVCANFRKFENVKKCYEAQTSQTNYNGGSRFCQGSFAKYNSFEY